MSKIICDVCGTVYQNTADHCPICGYARNSDGTYSPAATDPEHDIGGKYTSVPEKKIKTIFDFDEVNPEPAEEVSDEFTFEEVSDYDESPRANTFLVVILVIAITLLLLGIGFLFFRYFLPNQVQEAPETKPIQTEQAVLETEEIFTEPTIPCTSLALTSGVAELNREGQYWLLHVTVMPEDTTDQLVYTSEDESIVTVNEQGRIAAVGEGETNVYITCGEKQIKCKVVVKFEEASSEVTTDQAATEPESVDHEDIPDESQAPTQAETQEATEPTEENVVLKLKDSDLSSSVRGVSFELKLDCNLKPEDITWLTLDSSVAIVKNGVVTTIGPGRTKIVAQYKGQQAECIIRCTFQ